MSTRFAAICIIAERATLHSKIRPYLYICELWNKCSETHSKFTIHPHKAFPTHPSTLMLFFRKQTMLHPTFHPFLCNIIPTSSRNFSHTKKKIQNLQLKLLIRQAPHHVSNLQSITIQVIKRHPGQNQAHKQTAFTSHILAWNHL